MIWESTPLTCFSFLSLPPLSSPLSYHLLLPPPFILPPPPPPPPQVCVLSESKPSPSVCGAVDAALQVIVTQSSPCPTPALSPQIPANTSSQSQVRTQVISVTMTTTWLPQCLQHVPRSCSVTGRGPAGGLCCMSDPLPPPSRLPFFPQKRFDLFSCTWSYVTFFKL